MDVKPGKRAAEKVHQRHGREQQKGRIWPLVKRLRETGGEYHKNGHTEHVGEFAITSITADGTMVVGCHTLLAPELDKMAVLLGLPAVKGA